MLKSIHVSLGVGTMMCATACSSYPAPNQRMADAVATSRAAQEIGANNNPKAQLHLKLASEEIEQAKKLMADGDHKRADFVLVRAKADADLALVEAREVAAQGAARSAIAKADALQSELQQAQTSAPASTTTTTGSTVPGPIQQPSALPSAPRSNIERGAR